MNLKKHIQKFDEEIKEVILKKLLLENIETLKPLYKKSKYNNFKDFFVNDFSSSEDMIKAFEKIKNSKEMNALIKNFYEDIN